MEDSRTPAPIPVDASPTRLQRFDGFLRRNAAVLTLLLLSFSTRFYIISHPDKSVWDEQGFHDFVRSYFDANYSLDIHPPLGKLILYWGVRISGYNSAGVITRFEDPWPPGYPYVICRALNALAGALLPLILYGIARTMGINKFAAWMAALLVILDNAILCESRLSLIDIFLHAFGMLGIFALLRHFRTRESSAAWWAWLVLAGVFGAAAFSVKMTGLGYEGMILLFGLFAPCGGTWKTAIARVGTLSALLAFVYLSICAYHITFFKYKGTDWWWMNEEFNQSLQSRTSPDTWARPRSLFKKTIDYNRGLLNLNRNNVVEHPGQSSYNEWLRGAHRIYYWGDHVEPQRSIYQAANPPVWFFGLCGLTLGLFLFFRRRRACVDAPPSDLYGMDDPWRLTFLLVFYLANWAPFIFIHRCMFMYHYIAGLVVSLLLASYLFFDLLPRVGYAWSPRRLAWMAGSLIALVLGWFIFLAPVTYGLMAPWQETLLQYIESGWCQR